MKIGNYNIKLITQKLILSKRIVSNRFFGKVFFEKYEPKKNNVFTFGTISSGSIVMGSGINVRNSCDVIIGNGQSSVGGYDVGGCNSLVLLIKKRPTLFQRIMMKLFFGWEWIDKEKL